jgi:hypothetical protein
MPSDQDRFDARVKLAVYRHFAGSGERPALARIATEVGSDAGSIAAAYARLQAKRVLVIENDAAIRMAPPFSGVPTQHVVESAGVRYFANCAWDALGVPAALHRDAIVRSRCGDSGEPLEMQVGAGGPGPTSWVFHCLVPAAHWWDDIVFT